MHFHVIVVDGVFEAPRVSSARGPPLWDECGAQQAQELGQGVEALPDWDA